MKISNIGREKRKKTIKEYAMADTARKSNKNFVVKFEQDGDYILLRLNCIE